MTEIDEIDDELMQLAKNKEHEEFMKLIMYRSQRKWYATLSIIFIFGPFGMGQKCQKSLK